MQDKINYHHRFIVAAIVQLIFIVVEIYYGLQANSVALISDAIHNASDVLGLLIAWGGFALAEVKTSNRFTFGLKNTTILAAFFNAVVILVATGGIGWEAIQRMAHPQMIDSSTVIIVAGAGVVVNGLCAVLFLSGKNDINIWGAFMHLAADAAVSFGVIVASIGILLTGWSWLDPAASVLISILILVSAWGLFKESSKLILHAVPVGIDINQVRAFLLTQPNVYSLHDLHIWAISTTETAISVHLVLSSTTIHELLLPSLAKALEQRFAINHATIQLEMLGKEHCETQCRLT